MEITNETLIGSIVRTNYSTARVFEEFGIDYCCGGEKPLEHACSAEGVDITMIIGKLEEAMVQEDRPSKFIENLPLSTLCDYIVETHHHYIHDRNGFISDKLQKLCEVHGDRHPELFKVRELFAAATSSLVSHMDKEEKQLFPYIRRMESLKDDDSGPAAAFLSSNDPMPELREEHLVEGERFRRLSVITRQFQVPADACNTYELAYRALHEFVRDLHRHIHLENNILFPRAVQLRNELTQRH